MYKHLQRATRLLALILCLITLVAPAMASSQGDSTTMVAVNVGKADAILLIVEGHHYLIDTGSAQSYGRLREALSRYSVDSLDGVFLTHTHKDHAGGISGLLADGIEIKALYASAMYTDVKEKKHPMTLAGNALALPVNWLQGGDTISLSATARFEVLGPLSLDEGEENNNSMVLHLRTEDGTILLTGDMNIEEAAELLAAGAVSPCDVLKVPYHGGEDGASRSFIQKAQPKIALISTNTAQRSSTPHYSILQMLAEVSAQTVVTQDVSGAVVIGLNKGEITLSPEDWNDLPPMTSGIKIDFVSASDEQLRLSHQGTEPLSLAGWYLYSTRGDEVFHIPGDVHIEPGNSLIIGTESTEGACDLCWPEKNAWHNSKEDIAILYDAWGRAVASASNLDALEP